MREAESDEQLRGSDILKDEERTLPRWAGHPATYAPEDLVQFDRLAYVVVVRSAERIVERIYRGPVTDTIVRANDEMVTQKITKIWRMYREPEYAIIVSSGPLRDIAAVEPHIGGWKDAPVEELWSV